MTVQDMCTTITSRIGDNRALLSARRRRLAAGMSVALAMILSHAGSGMAQVPAWAVATWKGTLDSYRNDPNGADRVLVVSADGKCGWDYAAAAAAASIGKQSCTVADDSVTLLTSAGSTIKLQHKGGKLEGTFQTKGGRSYLITMTRQ